MENASTVSILDQKPKARYKMIFYHVDVRALYKPTIFSHAITKIRKFNG